MDLLHSTRGDARPVDVWAAIIRGIAPDGGLFAPAAFPRMSEEELEALVPLSYRERALAVLSRWLGGDDPAALSADIDSAYRRFDAPAVTPLAALDQNLWVMELWHGPTAAFKDVALQLLPRLLTRARQRTGEERQMLILTATSGDTGKAALEGFMDVPGTRIVVFYPRQGVSPMQELQMTTQRGRNTHVIAVEGNFDDAQSGVKALFTHPDWADRIARLGYVFSSANSINYGRLVPQIVYYVSAWCDLRAAGAVGPGQAVDFVVPTGNFGDILAGWYAKQMGLPVGKLVCASNKNHVLADFLETGVYDTRRPFYTTQSPSMDILVSSNLERLLYHAAGNDGARVRGWMNQRTASGAYTVEEDVRAFIARDFACGWADEEETRRAIAHAWNQYHYLLDPHTAVAYAVQARRETRRPTVILSTAHPCKFPADVYAALTGRPAPGDAFAQLDALEELTGIPVPAGLSGLRDLPVLHRAVCAPEGMPEALMEALEG